MSAFGRRSGGGSAPGGRPQFGTAQPMKGPSLAKSEGGSQFPPLEPEAIGAEEESFATDVAEALMRSLSPGGG